MANQLTGEFDVVGQAGINVVNDLVRVMHQNSEDDTGLPVLPHRLAVNVEYASGSWSVSGSAFVQVGVRRDPPVLRLVAGAPTDVRILVPIRARYIADPGTTALPEFILGDVKVRYTIAPESESGVMGFRLTASPDDSEIGFAGNVRRGTLSPVVRHFVRTRLQAFLPLPDEFQGAPPIVLGLVDPAGAQAVAVPFSLSGASGDPASVTRVVASPDEVAIAVSKDVITGPIQKKLDALKATRLKFTVKVANYKLAHYTVRITAATATWSEGSIITITVKGNATTGSILPNASFSVTVKLRLRLSSAGLSIESLGSPSVSVSVGGSLPGFVKDKVEETVEDIIRDRIVSERDAALVTANELVRDAFAQTDQIQTLLRAIDDKAVLSFKRTTYDPYDPDGLILRGSVKLSSRKQPHVEFEQLGNGAGYTAFESWIPGGWVEGFHWTWYWASDTSGPRGLPQVEQRDVMDRFVLVGEDVPLQAVMSGNGKVLAPVAQVCLYLIGHAGWQYPAAKLIPWAKCVLQYIPDPPYPPHTRNDVTLGRVDLLGERVRWRSNVLVQRVAVRQAADVVRLITGSVRDAARPEAALTVALVIPARSFTDVSAEVAGIKQRKWGRNLRLIAVEDVDGSWSRALDLPGSRRTSASRLVDPGGRVVWQYDGMPDRAALAAVLREHLQPATLPTMQLLGAGVEAGQVAPDFFFDGVSGGRLALRWLRGRLVVLVFAETDAPLSRRALQGLRHIGRGADRYGLFPLAVVEAASKQTVRILRRELRLEFPLIADTDRSISERYGIRCWPTTVVIDRDGTVAHVSLGATRAPAREIVLATSEDQQRSH